MSDLWPDLGNISKVRTPKSILEEQGTILASRTNGIVEGVVQKLDSELMIDLNDRVRLKRYGTDFMYRFYLYSSVLSYRTPLLTVSHGIQLYPLAVIWDNGQKIQDTSKTRINLNAERSLLIVANDEQFFLQTLRQIFSDNTTTKVITAIISQAE